MSNHADLWEVAGDLHQVLHVDLCRWPRCVTQHDVGVDASQLEKLASAGTLLGSQLAIGGPSLSK